MSKSFLFELDLMFKTVRDNEGEGAPAGDQTPVPAAKPPVPSNQNPPAGDPPNGEKPVSMEEHEKLRKQAQSAVQELENLRKISSMTKEERDKLDKRISELNNELLSEKQRLERNQKQQTEKYTLELEAEKSRADNFEKLYKTSSIQRSLTDAAVKHGAVNPIQVVNMLDRHTEMVPVEEAGVPTGAFTPKTTVMVKEGDKMVPVKMSPEDAVKNMADQSEFFNFFQANLKSGTGRHNSGGGTGSSLTRAEAAKLPAAQYREWKKNNPDK